MTLSSLKISLSFVLFFGLFYVEPIHVGPVTIAILWKSLLLSALFLLLFSRRGKIILHRLTAWGLLFVVACLLNESLFIDPAETISNAIKNAYIPIIFGFVFQTINKSARSIELSRSFMLRLCTFIVLSTIPFLLNIISPLSTGYDLSIFGEALSEELGFVGIFQNSHGASITLMVASATLLWGLPYIQRNSTRFFYLAMVSVGSIASVLTFVRTGLAMLVGAAITMLVISRNRIHFYSALAIVMVAIWTGFYLFDTSETFRLRMLGLNIYSVQHDASLTQISSGRVLYWTSALDRFFSAPFPEQILGFGPTLAKDYMLEAVGRRVYAHNGFIDVLQFSGYFGLVAYSMMMFQFFRILFALERSNPYFVLLAIHLTTYLVGMLFQGERYFLADVLFALALAGAASSREGRASVRLS